jgi:hypothetical protein
VVYRSTSAATLSPAQSRRRAGVIDLFALRDLSGAQHAETQVLSGCLEALIVTDEQALPGRLARPNQGSSQLQSITAAQVVREKKRLSQISNMVAWQHFPPRSTQHL